MKKKEDLVSTYAHSLDEVKYRCKCGHRVVIPKWIDKQICTWCKCYVFKSKKDEFEYRMKERLNYAGRSESAV